MKHGNQIIKSESEYQKIIDCVDLQLNLDTPLHSKKGEQIEAALILIKKYEDVNYPIPLTSIQAG